MGSVPATAYRLPEMKPAFNAPKGTADVVPPRSQLFEWVIETAVKQCRIFGYERVETPAFEHTEVFESGLESTSDIVTKEMYTFTDKGDRSLTLRPDMTAPVLRAIIENRLDKAALPVKLYYVASVFRHEKPQAGRQRQFTQVGVEAVGSEGPEIDAEVIGLAWNIYRACGVEGVTLYLNSIGHPECRAAYMPNLVEFLESHKAELCTDCQRKITTNPLRTFDCKVPSDRELMKSAPLITDHLCTPCKEHYEDLKSLLTDLGVEFVEEPKLVRGLDYYTRTAFEFVAGGLGAQDSIGAGGRYNGLAESLGGDHLPGVGFGLGIERIVLALEASGVEKASSIQVFVIALSEDSKKQAFQLLSRLRSAGISSDMDHMGRAAKAQFKAANRRNARWTAVIGDKEVSEGTVTLRDMLTGEEQQVPQSSIEQHIGAI